MVDSSRSRFWTRALSAAFLGGALLGAVACGKDAEDKLKGKWTGDRIENVDDAQVARATGWVKGTSFEFAGDKLTVTIPAEAPRTGSFKVAKVEGDKMVLAVKRSDAPVEEPTTITMVDEKTMRWELGQSREVVLVRSQ